MTRTFRVNVTRTDRASLPAGAAIGFGLLLTAENHYDAKLQAMERMARCHDADLLFLESVQDVTP